MTFCQAVLKVQFPTTALRHSILNQQPPLYSYYLMNHESYSSTTIETWLLENLLWACLH